ncbi:MAG TPA: hypothetical protein VNO21_13680, partial [Polyangiaceae bacterium]|nr:hypothetical protein [Polyangiaceae bacterium]
MTTRSTMVRAGWIATGISVLVACSSCRNGSGGSGTTAAPPVENNSAAASGAAASSGNTEGPAAA